MSPHSPTMFPLPRSSWVPKYHCPKIPVSLCSGVPTSWLPSVQLSTIPLTVASVLLSPFLFSPLLPLPSNSLSNPRLLPLDDSNGQSRHNRMALPLPTKANVLCRAGRIETSGAVEGPPSATSVECDIIVGSGGRIVSNPLSPSVVSNCIQMLHCPTCILRWDGVVLEFL